MTSGEQLIDELRPVSFAIAYRMLGSVADAEDIVQEALIRTHQTIAAGQQLDSPQAFIATVTTRLAIDELRSARVRREQYVGEWLPEPIVTDALDDPASQAELADSLSIAMLRLLEDLSPEQRATLLLHDVFDYRYGEIAEMIGKSEANVRQLGARARRHVEEGRPRFRTSREQRDELARTFFAAVREGELGELEALLAADVSLTGDGGGKVPSLARTIRGRSRVAKTIGSWLRFGGRVGGSIREVQINGAPGAMLLDRDGRLFAVWSLDIVGTEIISISSIVNPEKLAHIGSVADVAALLDTARKRD
jgi:RNA polymerase sigma-70 factor (ECF subfamily)